MAGATGKIIRSLLEAPTISPNTIDGRALTYPGSGGGAIIPRSPTGLVDPRGQEIVPYTATGEYIPGSGVGGGNAGLLGGRVIDGEFVPVGPQGLPSPATPSIFPDAPAGGGGKKGLAAGAAALGAGGGMYAMMGDDELAQTPDGGKLSPQQQAILQHTKAWKEQAEQDQAAIEQEIKQTLPKEEGAWFDRFAQEFDLTTVGLALMGSADNGGSFAMNLGNALAAGRAAAHAKARETRELESAEAAAKTEAQRYADKMALEDRRIGALEKEAAAAEIKAKVAGLQARNEELKMAVQANQFKIPEMNTTDKHNIKAISDKVLGESLNITGKNPNSTDMMVANNAYTAAQLQKQRMEKAGQVVDINTWNALLAQQLQQQFVPGLINDTYDPKVMIGGQQTAPVIRRVQ